MLNSVRASRSPQGRPHRDKAGSVTLLGLGQALLWGLTNTPYIRQVLSSLQAALPWQKQQRQ